jgi:hypothetical protein
MPSRVKILLVNDLTGSLYISRSRILTVLRSLVPPRVYRETTRELIPTWKIIVKLFNSKIGEPTFRGRLIVMREDKGSKSKFKEVVRKIRRANPF